MGPLHKRARPSDPHPAFVHPLPVGEGHMPGCVALPWERDLCRGVSLFPGRGTYAGVCRSPPGRGTYAGVCPSPPGRGCREAAGEGLGTISFLALWRVITFFVAHLQLVRLSVLVHIEIWDFYAQLVKLSIRFSNLGNEADAVLIPKVRADLLVDARILADESRKETLATGRFGK